MEMAVMVTDEGAGHKDVWIYVILCATLRTVVPAATARTSCSRAAKDKTAGFSWRNSSSANPWPLAERRHCRCQRAPAGP